MKKHSLRIQKICDLVPDNMAPIYDLCCDHGHIGLELHLRNTKREVSFVDVVPQITERLHSYIPRSNNLKIFTEDATKLYITDSKNPIFIISGIGAELSYKIFQNLYKQKPEAYFLFCIHQKTEYLKEKLKAHNLKLQNNDFIFENKQGYEIFLVSHKEGKEIKIFDPSIYQYNMLEHKLYIEDIRNYYRTKASFAPIPQYRDYLEQLEAILACF